MEGDYVKEGREIKEKTDKEKELELIISIINAKNALENANKNYQYAEGNLIDYYLYEIKANQSKIDYLVRSAKELGIKNDIINLINGRGKRVV